MYRIGRVDYLNSIPLFYKWDDPQMDLIKGHPSHLVTMLRKGEIHAGIVSSVEYLINPQNYVYVPSISISSKEKVCSVGIFSKKPIQDIQKLYLTGNSLTSKYLCFYVLEHVYGLKPIYTEEKNNVDALLLIGNEALEEKKKENYPYFYDLAYEWYKVNKLPFVFALFLVRKEYADTLVGKIYNLCKRSLNAFFEDLQLGRVSMLGYSQEEITEYFLECLSNDLGNLEMESLRIFSQFLKERGYIAQSPL